MSSNKDVSMSLENPNSLSRILTSFRKCGFSLVIPNLNSKRDIYEWAVKASALAHGYTWDVIESGDDDISKLVSMVVQTGSMDFFDSELDVSDSARKVWAYAIEIVQLAVAMTNEQVEIGTLNRADIS